MPGNRLSDRGFTSTRGLSYTIEDTATNVDGAFPASHGLGAVPSSLELWVEVSAGEWEQHDASTYVTASSTALTSTGTTLASVVGGATNVRLVAAAGAVALSVAEASASQAGIVSTGTQTFGGAKTFSSLLSATAGANITGGKVGIGTASPAANARLQVEGGALRVATNSFTYPTSSIGESTTRHWIAANSAILTVYNTSDQAVNGVSQLNLGLKKGSGAATEAILPHIQGISENASDFSSSVKINTTSSTGAAVQAFLATSSGAVTLGLSGGGQTHDIYDSLRFPNGGNQAFDYYGAGTWTPTLPNGGTLSVTGARYMRVGNLCTATFYVVSISPTANGSEFQISLPFTSSNSSTTYYWGGNISYSATADSSYIRPLVRENTSYIYFHKVDGTTQSTINNNEWIATGIVAIIVTMTYETA